MSFKPNKCYLKSNTYIKATDEEQSLIDAFPPTCFYNVNNRKCIINYYFKQRGENNYLDYGQFDKYEDTYVNISYVGDYPESFLVGIDDKYFKFGEFLPIIGNENISINKLNKFYDKHDN